LNKAEAGGPGGTTYVTPTPGTYTCTTPGDPPAVWARFQYSTPDGSVFGSPSSGPAAASCQVVITAFGAIGESVVGSFTATLDRIAGSQPTPVVVSGTFDVVRAN